ncbi:hypothetical protein M758_UG237300 [Ceratodon purpureus]|nr:hypothetical protein M758_UG237300 [Ceratodon purpureus]
MRLLKRTLSLTLYSTWMALCSTQVCTLRDAEFFRPPFHKYECSKLLLSFAISDVGGHRLLVGFGVKLKLGFGFLEPSNDLPQI